MSALPLTGGCLCGAVRFEVAAPFDTVGYCHCTRCQRRTGAAASANGRVRADAFAIVAGEEHVRTWTPEDGGQSKSFCGVCGSALFSGPSAHGSVGVRLGALDDATGIRPEWRQWTSSAAGWEALPDDGLPRFPEGRPHQG